MRNKRVIILLTVVAVLVVAIVACGATFLVRDIEAYSYYNYTDMGEKNYDGLVIEASGLETSSSMFFVNEAAVKSNVENKYANIEVINVERKFPDRVCINYVVHERSFQYLCAGKYYQCYSSCRIGSSSDSALPGYFVIKPSGAVAVAEGKYFQSSGSHDRTIVEQFIKFMYRKGLNDTLINERIEFVDFRRDGYVWIRTRDGVSLEIKCGAEQFSSRLDDAWGAFNGYLGNDFAEPRFGLFRVENDSGEVKYSKPSGQLVGLREDGSQIKSVAEYYSYHYERSAPEKS